MEAGERRTWFVVVFPLVWLLLLLVLPLLASFDLPLPSSPALRIETVLRHRNLPSSRRFPGLSNLVGFALAHLSEVP